jgi:hypothetical protein
MQSASAVSLLVQDGRACIKQINGVAEQNLWDGDTNRLRV